MSPSVNLFANGLRIRTMRPGEISMAVRWAAAEGWNPGLADHACFAVVDPKGFFIGELGLLLAVGASEPRQYAAMLTVVILLPAMPGLVLLTQMLAKRPYDTRAQLFSRAFAVPLCALVIEACYLLR